MGANPGKCDDKFPSDARDVGYVNASERVLSCIVRRLFVPVIVDVDVLLYARDSHTHRIVIETDTRRKKVQEDLSLDRNRGSNVMVYWWFCCVVLLL